MPKNILPIIQKKLTHFSDQVLDHAEASSSRLNWYANKSNLFDTFEVRK